MSDTAEAAPAQASTVIDIDAPIPSPSEELIKAVGEGSADTPPADQDAEGADAAEAKVDENAEEKPAEVQTFDVDGEDIPVDTLKEAYTKAADVAQREEHLNEVIANFKERPGDTMLQIFTEQCGGDREKGFAQLVSLSEQVIAYHLKREELSPDERRAISAEEKAAALTAKLEAKEKAEQDAADASAAEEAVASIQQEMTAEFSKAGLADTPRNRQRVAEAVVKKWDKGLKSYTVGDAARAVKVALAKENDARRKEFLAEIKPEDLSPEQLAALRAHNVSATKTNLANPKTPNQAEAKPGMVKLPRRKMLI